MTDKRLQEIDELRGLVDELNLKTARYEIEKANMRAMRHRLDNQIELFRQIHRFTQRAFGASSMEDLANILSEGVVDVFQLETAATFRLDVSGDHMDLFGSCNFNSPDVEFPVSMEWLRKPELHDFRRRTVVAESSDLDSPFSPLNLSYAICVPLFDNDRKMVGIILGGITEEGALIYDRIPEVFSSSFLVYCQTMNGIYNNLIALDQARAGVRAKSRFLSSLSHEIRTPMNAIIGMTQIASHSEKPEELKKCVSQIDISSRHLLGLLNDVLDMSKIDEGKLVLENSPFVLGPILENIIGGLRSIAVNKGLDLMLDANGTENLALSGDSMRLSQVLINFISNALKFTESGCVTLDARAVSQDSEKILMQFAVTDTGIGMSEEAVSRIFSPFEQADASMSRKYGGTGLGLSISSSIVKLMESEIHVESAPGEGSRFSFQAWFDLDKKAAAAEDSVEEEWAQKFSGAHIMIVDDVQINREIIMAFLDDTGAACECASNGQEAVDMFAASEENYYGLILMDVQMPVLDGCDAARRIRAMERRDAKTVTIIALTANVLKEDLQEAIAAGMNGYAGKPVEYSTIMKVVDQALHGDSDGQRRSNPR
ncbi:MAG: response regulator [Synergistaceae bacterium]|jgi:CheY-like chemotaxis protein/nitrogen-specific signal transduction histidine kinase|nr:response regulator [Synergistaceae bacterium]